MENKNRFSKCLIPQNLNTIGLSVLEQLLAAYFEVFCKFSNRFMKAIFNMAIMGMPGCGKTATVEAVVRKMFKVGTEGGAVENPFTKKGKVIVLPFTTGATGGHETVGVPRLCPSMTDICTKQIHEAWEYTQKLAISEQAKSDIFLKMIPQEVQYALGGVYHMIIEAQADDPDTKVIIVIDDFNKSDSPFYCNIIKGLLDKKIIFTTLTVPIMIIMTGNPHHPTFNNIFVDNTTKGAISVFNVHSDIESAQYCVPSDDDNVDMLKEMHKVNFAKLHDGENIIEPPSDYSDRQMRHFYEITNMFHKLDCYDSLIVPNIAYLLASKIGPDVAKYWMAVLVKGVSKGVISAKDIFGNPRVTADELSKEDTVDINAIVVDIAHTINNGTQAAEYFSALEVFLRIMRDKNKQHCITFLSFMFENKVIQDLFKQNSSEKAVLKIMQLFKNIKAPSQS